MIRRLRVCVERWPECEEGTYDPRCCRFPKSCSCTVYSHDVISEDELEPMTKQQLSKKDAKKDAPHASLQWKGTKTCLDFTCECGAIGHLDSYFAYVIMCPMCGRKYGLISNIALLDLSPGAELGKVEFKTDVGEQVKWLTYWEDQPKLINGIKCPECGDVNSRWESMYEMDEIDKPKFGTEGSVSRSGVRVWQLKCMNGHRILGWPEKLPEWLTDEVIRHGQPT